MLDDSSKIFVLVSFLMAFRILIGLWKTVPKRAFFLELSNSALIAFGLVFLLIRPFLLQAFYIPSGSMETTLHGPDSAIRRSGDRILVNKFIYRLSFPKRGDIVVFRAPAQAFWNTSRSSQPANGSSDFIKRVVGLPGEQVKVVRGDGVYIDDKKLDEPYLNEPPDYDWPLDGLGISSDMAYVVPEDSILVMGDNRNNSNDSHLWRDPISGESQPALPMKNVLGRAMMIFWPPGRLGRLTR